MEEIKLALESLEESGELTASRVLEAARDPASPLHASFEWDDSEAAEQYRLQQARHLIRAVIVIVGEEDPLPVRLYVNVAAVNRTEGKYVRIDRLDDDDLAVALDKAIKALDVARQRISDLQNFAGKTLDIVEVHQSLDDVKAKIRELVSA